MPAVYYWTLYIKANFGSSHLSEKNNRPDVDESTGCFIVLNPMLDSNLLQIGFTKVEAKIYLELLRIGPQPASILAKRLEVNRTTVYMVLKILEKKGVISFYKNGNSINHFSANDPNCLVGYIDRRCRTFDYYRSQILNVIPKFREISCSFDFKKPVVSYFDGIEGVKQLECDALNAQSEFCCFFSVDRWFDLGEEQFLLNYKKKRISEKKLLCRMIVSDTELSRSYFETHYVDDDLSEVVFLNCEKYTHLFENEMSIYDNKVVILHLNKGSEFGVLIESQEAARMHGAIFEILWDGFV